MSTAEGHEVVAVFCHDVHRHFHGLRDTQVGHGFGNRKHTCVGYNPLRMRGATERCAFFDAVNATALIARTRGSVCNGSHYEGGILVATLSRGLEVRSTV